MILTVPLLRCKTCQAEKPETEYLDCHLRMVTPKTPTIHCRTCFTSKRTAAARAKGVPPRSAKQDPAVAAAAKRVYMQQYRIENEHVFRRSELKKYDITLEQYDAMLEQQGGVCAVPDCDATAARSNAKYLCVDHDHATGEIRGLLCGPCNFAVGNASDSPARLRALADYLESRS